MRFLGVLHLQNMCLCANVHCAIACKYSPVYFGSQSVVTALCSLTHLNHLLCMPLLHRVTLTAVSLVAAYLSDPFLIFALHTVVLHSHFFIVLDASKIKSLSLILQINNRLDLLSLKKQFGHDRRKKKNYLAHSSAMQC